MNLEIARKVTRGEIRELWLESMDLPPEVLASTFRWGQGRIIDGIMADPAVVTLAGFVDGALRAFVVGSRGVSPDVAIIHYVWVDQLYRRRGWATELVKAIGASLSVPAVFTHETLLGRGLMYAVGATYNPYLAYELISRPSDGKKKRTR